MKLGKKGKTAGILLMTVVLLLLCGCGLEEKTMILPGEESGEAAGEVENGAGGFAIKRIYSYEYETSSVLQQSAFLQDCGDNEIRVAALEEQAGETELVCREVDYRYGFYQTEGEFFGLWESWGDAGEGEMEGDLYISRIEPSPNGKQLLVYGDSAFWERNIVLLYQLGVQEPWQLYDGPRKFFQSSGSFTSDGRWMTFEALGDWLGEEWIVPVYDSRLEPDQQKMVLEDSTQICPPDLMLRIMDPRKGDTWEANLDELSGEVGMTSFAWDFQENAVRATMDFPGMQSSYILGGEVGYNTLYLQYQLEKEENRIYYLTNDMRLWNIDMSDGNCVCLMDFQEPVLDFMRLESGDMLVLTMPDTGTGNSDYDSNVVPDEIREGDSRLMWIQKCWNARSVDLYLYPEGESQGELLYKGLRNLVSMEYDQKTGRILLETCEDRKPGQRKCLILEMQ